MTHQDRIETGVDLESIFLVNRAQLRAFICSRGAADLADDILQDLWIRMPRQRTDIASPLSYLYRMATYLVFDRNQSRSARLVRDTAWFDAHGSIGEAGCAQPTAERVMEARQTVSRALEAVSREGERVLAIFRRHRIDGLTQREVASEFGVSIGTVEGDLRKAYRALVALEEH